MASSLSPRPRSHSNLRLPSNRIKENSCAPGAGSTPRILGRDAGFMSAAFKSLFGAFPAAALPARGAEKAAAVPTPRNGLDRLADQLSHQENFDHSGSPYLVRT